MSKYAHLPINFLTAYFICSNQLFFKTMRLTCLLWLCWMLFIPSDLSAQSISKRGYPEHFIVGSFIGAGVSTYVYKKTQKRGLSWVAGVSVSALAGFLKEVVDSTLLGKRSNWNDFNYTVLGGVTGASIVIPLNKPKKVNPVRL